MSDSSVASLQLQTLIFYQMSPAKRFQCGLQMIDDGCRIVDNSLYAQDPTCSMSELRVKRLYRLYGQDLSADVLEACSKGIRRFWQSTENAETENDGIVCE